MERVPGGSRAERVRDGTLPIPQVVEVARQALEGLAYLHAQQVVHRDVKPSNLLLDGHGQVKLAKVGLARSLVEGAEVTRTHASVGTPAYLSQEQLLGREPLLASDLDGLDAALFQLLTGRLPFDAASGGGAHGRRSTRPPSPRQGRPEGPAWLASFVLRLLEREPGDRFRDAAGALAAPERRRVLLSPRLWRRLWVGAAAAALAVVLGFGLWRRAVAKFASVSVAGPDVVALHRRGRELWRREFPGFEPVPLRADLLRDTAPKVRGVLGRGSQARSEGTEDLVILTGEGALAGSLASTMSRLGLDFPEFVAATRGPVVSPSELDGDNATDLVWQSPHLRWYPTVGGAWNRRQQDASLPLFVTSGAVQKLATADLDRDGRPELLAVGINTPQDYQLVLAIIRRAPTLRAPNTPPCHSPDMTSAWHGVLVVGLAVAPRYVPLGPPTARALMVGASHGGITRVAEEVRRGIEDTHAAAVVAASPLHLSAWLWGRKTPSLAVASVAPGGGSPYI